MAYIIIIGISVLVLFLLLNKGKQNKSSVIKPKKYRSKEIIAAIDSSIQTSEENSKLGDILYARKQCIIASEGGSIYEKGKSKYDISKEISSKEAQAYGDFITSLKQKLNSEKVWSLEGLESGTITKYEITITYGNLDYIQYDKIVPILHVPSQEMDIALYPCFIIKSYYNGKIDLLSWQDLNIQYDSIEIKEFPAYVANDSHIVRKEHNPNQKKMWDGHYDQPGFFYVVQYYYVTTNIHKLVITFSSNLCTLNFVKYLSIYQNQLNSHSEYISEEHYEEVNNMVVKMIDFIDAINTKEFSAYIESRGIKDKAGIIIPSKTLLQILILSDTAYSINEMQGIEIALTDKEGLALLLLSLYFLNQSSIEFMDYIAIPQEIYKSAEDFIDTATHFFNRSNQQISLLTPLLKEYDQYIQTQYLTYLYRLLSITSKADNVVTEKEEEYLKKLVAVGKEQNDILDFTRDVLMTEETIAELTEATSLNYSRSEINVGLYVVRNQKCVLSDIQAEFSISHTKAASVVKTLERIGVVQNIGNRRKVLIKTEADLVRAFRGESIRQTATANQSDTSTAIQNEEEQQEQHEPQFVQDKGIENRLSSMIGLTSVKQEIQTLINFIKIQQEREKKGLKATNVSYHCVFTGNPGTGKTTVARIVADIYRALGVLKKGHLVETDRAGLVAEYVGQTAVKTNKIIDSALDGVLFIDEAYSLIGEGQDYGKEAIATLLKRMEDDRDRLVVILAGYTKEMQDFINTNPGLQSRFNRYIEFPDYSSDELYQIFELNMQKFSFKITDDAKAALQSYFEYAVAHKDKNFGNGRFVRNVFEKTLERQANRLASIPNLTTEQLTKITIEDLPKMNELA